jgi:hypothetical protein
MASAADAAVVVISPQPVASMERCMWCAIVVAVGAEESGARVRHARWVTTDGSQCLEPVGDAGGRGDSANDR